MAGTDIVVAPDIIALGTIALGTIALGTDEEAGRAVSSSLDGSGENRNVSFTLDGENRIISSLEGGGENRRDSLPLDGGGLGWG